MVGKLLCLFGIHTYITFFCISESEGYTIKGKMCVHCRVNKLD